MLCVETAYKGIRIKMKLKETRVCDESLLKAGTEQRNLQTWLVRWRTGCMRCAI